MAHKQKYAGMDQDREAETPGVCRRRLIIIGCLAALVMASIALPIALNARSAADDAKTTAQDIDNLIELIANLPVAAEKRAASSSSRRAPSALSLPNSLETAGFYVSIDADRQVTKRNSTQLYGQNCWDRNDNKVCDPGNYTTDPDTAEDVNSDGLCDVEDCVARLEDETIAALRGEQGPQGEQGEQGERGIQGERGPPGPQGEQGVMADEILSLHVLESGTAVSRTGYTSTFQNSATSGAAAELQLFSGSSSTGAGLYFRATSNEGSLTYNHAENAMRFAVDSTQRLQLTGTFFGPDSNEVPMSLGGMDRVWQFLYVDYIKAGRGYSAVPSVLVEAGTGMYSPGTNRLGFSTGTVTRLEIGNSYADFDVSVSVPAGTVFNPSFRLGSVASNTGLYGDGSGVSFNVAVAGATRLSVNHATPWVFHGQASEVAKFRGSGLASYVSFEQSTGLSNGYIGRTGSTAGSSDFVLHANYAMKISAGDEVVKIGGHLRPTTANTYDIGQDDPTNTWRAVYSVTGAKTTSDQRYKEEVVGATPLGLDFVAALTPRTYRYTTAKAATDDGRQRDYDGFYAQEVRTVLQAFGAGDRAVVSQKDPNDPGSTMSLSYEGFIAPLARAIQELSAKVDALESKLHACAPCAA